MEALDKIPAEVDLKDLFAIFIGGAPITPKQLADARRTLKPAVVLQGYGATENTGGIIICLPSETTNIEAYYSRSATIGKVCPGNIVKVNRFQLKKLTSF